MCPSECITEVDLDRRGHESVVAIRKALLIVDRQLDSVKGRLDPGRHSNAELSDRRKQLSKIILKLGTGNPARDAT
jgi:hypothetical protein